MAAKDAEAAADCLERIRDPAITPHVIETARNRAVLVREAHAQVQFGPVGFAAIPNILVQINNRLAALEQNVQNIPDMQNNMAAMENHIASLAASTANTRTIGSNFRTFAAPYQPLRKENPGNGGDLVVPILPAGVAMPALPLVPAQVGELPPNFNGHPTANTHAEILALIVFYNDNFGIVAGDTINQRQEKLRGWLARP